MSADKIKKNDKSVKIYLKNILENLPEPIYWTDLNGRLLGCNQAEADLYGFASSQEMIGKDVFDMARILEWKKGIAEETHKNNEEVIRTGKSISKEEIMVCPRGKKRIHISHKSPLYDENHRIIGVIGASIDITERKELEEALRQAEARAKKLARQSSTYLKNILLNLPEPIYWIDKDSVILGCNEAEAKLFGFSSPKEIIGKSILDIGKMLGWENGVAETLRENDKQIMRTGIAVSKEEIDISLRGEKRIFITHKAPLYDENKNVIGVIGTSVNVTQLKFLEEKLRKTEASETRFKAMSVLGGMIAHELRTPLTTIGWGILTVQDLLPQLIQGYEKSVARGEVEPIHKRLLDGLGKSLDNIGRAVKYAQTTVSTVLSGFHYSDSDAKAKIVPFSLKLMIEQAVAEYPFDVEEEGLITIKHVDDMQVRGEQQMVVHVLYNLLKNALHVIHEEGKGNISIWSEFDKEKIYLYIEDTAKGIAPDQLPHIFEAFYTTKKETAVSVGLGLYFCKMVLQKMSGDITCESELGKYTRFKITLPLAINT